MIDPNDRGLKEVAFVKFFNPSEYIFDILPEDVELETEEKIAIEHEELLNGYFRNREKETIEGREFVVGETVAVCLDLSWRPAICTDINYVSNNLVYEVLLMDCGQIIDVPMMHFRPYPFTLKMTSRYNSFVLLDILPAGMRNRPLKFGWEADADEDVRLLFQLASRIFVEIIAYYPLAGYNRLFGNVYLQMHTKIIDLKKHLLDQEWAFENPVMFQRFYQLTEDHFVSGKRDNLLDVTNTHSLQNVQFVAPLQPQEITDETLDNYLPDYWKIGGTDPLSQVERENFRRKIMGEARIGFCTPGHGYKEVQDEELLTKKMEECSVQEKEYSKNLTELRRHGNQSKESEKYNTEDPYKGGHNFTYNNCNGNSTEETSPQRREIYKHLRGENVPMNDLFLSPPRNSNDKTRVKTPMTDEVKKCVKCIYKDTNDTEDQQETKSVPKEFTWTKKYYDVDSPRRVENGYSSSSSNKECSRRIDEISPKSVKGDFADEAKQKIFALFKH